MNFKVRGSFNKWAWGAAVLLLAGCGNDYPDQAEISSSDRLDPSLQDQSRQARVLYFDNEAINDSLEIQQFKNALTEWLASPGEELPDVELPDDAEQVWEAAERFQQQRENLNDAWRANIEETTAPLVAELETQQSELAELEETKAAFDEALAPTEQKITAIEARINKAVERQAEMARTMVEGWNSYILDNDLAVRTLDPERTQVFSYRGWTNTDNCPSSADSVTVNRLAEEETCYHLWLPDETLQSAPINDQYAELFDEYQELTELVGRRYQVRGETDTLNQQLRDAQEERSEDLIRAENRHGDFRQLERALSSTQRQVERIQERIENADSDWNRSSFEQNQMREYRGNVQQELSRYVAEATNDIVSSVPSSDLSTTSAFPLEHQAELLVFDIPISSFMGSGNILILEDMREPGEEEVLDVVPSQETTSTVSPEELPNGITELVVKTAR